MASHSAGGVIDVTRGFEGAVLGPILVAEAAHRVLAYCTEPRSGWGSYDLAAVHAQQLGTFESVTPWSLLYANALNGQVTLDNVTAFDRGSRQDFAALLAKISSTKNLHEMDDGEVVGVVDACCFGFPGVWGPKITKLGALYRPKAIPVLDGHVAEAFGFTREAFTLAAPQRSMTRRERIEKVVRALASSVAEHRSELDAIRRTVMSTVPEIKDLSDLRLVDIAIWTAQDDRMARRPRQGPRWIDRPVGQRIPIDDLTAAPVISGWSPLSGDPARPPVPPSSG